LVVFLGDSGFWMKEFPVFVSWSFNRKQIPQSIKAADVKFILEIESA
jgi:hypothetical protein